MIPESFSQLREDNQDRSAYRRTWNLCMMPADAAAFSAALNATFPTIRFRSRWYWEQFWDQERLEADRRENERLVQRGLPSRPIEVHRRDPTGEPLRYWGSLADPAESRFIAWIEPPGWEPVWAPPGKFGERYIENTPRLWFEFHRSDFILRRPNFPRRHETEPQPRNARETIELKGETFEVRWNPSEAEAEAFAKKVYNILRKLTVYRFIDVEGKSRRAFTGEAHGGFKQCLAGHHAAAWALKRRHNYFGCNNWPGLLKPASYPFQRRDVFTKAENRRWRANLEKRFQEELRLRMEAYERFRGRRGDIEFESRGDKLVAARLYKPWEERSTMPPEAPAASRVAMELRTVRRRGRLQWR